MSAPDICIYLYICILFVQINVSSDVAYSRETQREGAGTIQKQVKYFSIRLGFPTSS